MHALHEGDAGAIEIGSDALVLQMEMAQAEVQRAENALSRAVLERDELVVNGIRNGLSTRAIARTLGVDPRAVMLIKTRATWSVEADDVARQPSTGARKQAIAATSWLRIALQQVERAEEAEEDGMPDGMLAVLAAHVATLCAIGALGRTHPAVLAYLRDGVAGHDALKSSRDLMAHFDMYVRGDGNMQRAKVEGVFIPNPVDARPPLVPMWNGGRGQQLVFITKTWVRGDSGEYLLRDGKPLRRDDGSPWMETLIIPLDLREALRATASLLSAACEHAGLAQHKQVHELLERARA